MIENFPDLRSELVPYFAGIFLRNYEKNCYTHPRTVCYLHDLILAAGLEIFNHIIENHPTHYRRTVPRTQNTIQNNLLGQCIS